MGMMVVVLHGTSLGVLFLTIGLDQSREVHRNSIANFRFSDLNLQRIDLQQLASSLIDVVYSSRNNQVFGLQNFVYSLLRVFLNNRSSDF
jgi:hypothetical protein